MSSEIERLREVETNHGALKEDFDTLNQKIQIIETSLEVKTNELSE